MQTASSYKEQQRCLNDSHASTKIKEQINDALNKPTSSRSNRPRGVGGASLT